MNHILAQNQKIAELKEENKILKEGYQSLKEYLQMRKYDHDINVNKNDILLRISEILYSLP